jgi:hypothetical protein
LLKNRTASEKVKEEAKWNWLGVKEEQINRKQAATDEVGAQSQKLHSDAKELYTTAEPSANATIKQQEDVYTQEITIGHRE